MVMETTSFVGIQFCLMRICLMRRSLLPFKIKKFASRDQGRLHPSKFNGRIDQLKNPLGRRRLICKKNTHTCLQIQVHLFILVYFFVIVRGRTMGKLVSIVTTCLVVWSNRVNFWKSLSGSTDPTTDRYGHDGPSRGSRSKTLRLWKNWILRTTL